MLLMANICAAFPVQSHLSQTDLFIKHAEFVLADFSYASAEANLNFENITSDNSLVVEIKSLEYNKVLVCDLGALDDFGQTEMV